MLKVEGLQKRFGGVAALRGVGFHLPRRAILGVIGMFGFLTRWASAVQTPLEPVAVAVAHQALGHQGWRPSPYTAHPPTKPSTAKPPPDTPAR